MKKINNSLKLKGGHTTEEEDEDEAASLNRGKRKMENWCAEEGRRKWPRWGAPRGFSP